VTVIFTALVIWHHSLKQQFVVLTDMLTSCPAKPIMLNTPAVSYPRCCLYHYKCNCINISPKLTFQKNLKSALSRDLSATGRNQKMLHTAMAIACNLYHQTLDFTGKAETVSTSMLTSKPSSSYTVRTSIY
jgi:hypothetical protein